MTRWIHRAIGVICFASILAGCIPYRFIDVPGFRGTVVSAKVGQAVVGARVSLSMGRGSTTEKPIGSVQASSAGAFILEPKRYWSIYIVPMDFIGYFGTVEVAASGFKTVRIPFKSAPDAAACTEIGEVRLEPAG